MIPLAEAWDSGAYTWSASLREAFANDLGVSWSLIAVSASSNRSKGDRDPAEWLPPKTTYWCTYLGDWLAVKVRWSLSVDATEHAALDSLIVGCPYTRRPVVPANGSRRAGVQTSIGEPSVAGLSATLARYAQASELILASQWLAPPENSVLDF